MMEEGIILQDVKKEHMSLCFDLLQVDGSTEVRWLYLPGKTREEVSEF